MWQIHTPDSKPSPLSKPKPSDAEPACWSGVWSVGSYDWGCQAAGGAAGITLGDAASSLCLRVANVGNDVLPLASEQYVCGDAWKIHFPQVSGQYSLRVSIRVVDATATRIVLEPTFSIQTSLLDSEPSLELTAVGTRDLSFVDVVPAGITVSAIRGTGTAGQLIVLFGAHDAPFTKARSSAGRLDLRIFGEFLEKGVICKARPWVIIDRTSEGVSAADLQRYCEEFVRTPLPLTA